MTTEKLKNMQNCIYHDLGIELHDDSMIETTIRLLGKRIEDTELELWKSKSELKEKERQLRAYEMEIKDLREERDNLKRQLKQQKTQTKLNKIF